MGIDNGEVINPCPYCMQINTKLDTNCDHVKCYYCSKDYCIAGACKREPTMAHGNHYHRPKCKYFSAYDGPDLPQPNHCSACKLILDNGGDHICLRPKDLENLDIPQDERPV